MRSLCQVPGCPTPINAKGLCNKHYKRWKTYGDVYKVQIIIGDDTARFWSHVRKGQKNDCWPWLSKRDARGYGRFSVTRRGRQVELTAHRFAWEAVNGPIPGNGYDHVIMHECDNPPCCNPGHLKHGTQRQNVQDMVARGRYVVGDRTGAKNGRALLSDEVVSEIRQSTESSALLSERLGVSRQTIWSIRANKSWKG